MRLELHKHRIGQVDFGKTTKIQDGTLVIRKEELIQRISQDLDVTVDVEICRPGESVRISNVIDILEPRVKSEGSGIIFPGFLGPPEKAGRGKTKVLKGVAVMEVAAIPRLQEGLVDMGGEGARYSPFSRTHNIILLFEPAGGVRMEEFEGLIRLAGLRAGAFLAGACLDEDPDEIEKFVLDRDHADTQESNKRIAYIYMLQSQGSLRDTFLYGRSVGDLSPSLIHPNEIMDGAIVSGNYVIPSNRNPTFFHLNNPVIRDLYLSQGKGLRFSGVVLCNEHSCLEGKEKTARQVVDILEGLEADGAIITKEGGGNADTDLMLMCRTCESRGIRAVLIGNEGAGNDGADPSLVDSTPEADAFVTTGNNDELVELDPVEKLIGHGPLPGIETDLKGALTIPVSRIHGATNLLGYGRLSSRSS